MDTKTQKTAWAALLALTVLFAWAAAALAPARAETPHPLRLFWAVPGDQVTLTNGWTLTTTASPMIEVADGSGTVLGSIELLNFTLDNDLARAEGEQALREALRRRVEDFHRVVGEDRAASSPELEYRPGGTRFVRFGETLAVRLAATTVDRATGEVVERIRTHLAVAANQFWVLAVNGVDQDAVTSDLMVLQPHQVRTLAAHLDDVVAASPLPALGTGVSDGAVIGVDGGLDGGRLYLVWQGRKHRIAQPRPMDWDDAGRHQVGPRVAALGVEEADTGSFFAVIPPDGDASRLYLVVDGTFHEVVVQAVTPETAAGLPDGDGSALVRVTAPAS